MKDKYSDEPVLDIIDTEDTPEEKKIKNEEQVNRILNTFKNYGVAANPGSKRKFDQEPSISAEEEVKRKKHARKEKREYRKLMKAVENENRARNGEGLCCFHSIPDHC